MTTEGHTELPFVKEYERTMIRVQEVNEAFRKQKEAFETLGEDMDKIIEAYGKVKALKKISGNAPKRNSNYTPPKKKRKRRR